MHRALIYNPFKGYIYRVGTSFPHSLLRTRERKALQSSHALWQSRPARLWSSGPVESFEPSKFCSRKDVGSGSAVNSLRLDDIAVVLAEACFSRFLM